MAQKYYLWSNLVTPEKNDRLKPGDEVTASNIGVSDEDFQAYIESGAVRTTPYPDMPEGFTGSPREFRLAQLAAFSRGEEYDVYVASLGGEAYANPDLPPAPEEVEDGKAEKK